MVKEGDCGFFVDPENPVALAEKLIEVKDQKELELKQKLRNRPLAMGATAFSVSSISKGHTFSAGSVTQYIHSVPISSHSGCPGVN